MVNVRTKSGLVGCGGGVYAHREDGVGAIAVQIVWSSRRGSRPIEHLVSARIIEPTSKADALRVLAETGVESVSYRTVKRRLPLIAKTSGAARIVGSMRRPRRVGAGV